MTREASSELQEQYKSTNPDLNPLFTFAIAGFNMRSTELNAVLGIEQMKRLDYNIQCRINNLDIWLSNLDKNKFITDFNTTGNSNFALPLVMQEDTCNKLKDVCKILEEEGVEYRLGTAGGGNQARQPYLKKFNYEIVGTLIHSDYIHENALYVGNHPELTKEQIINICKKINNV